MKKSHSIKLCIVTAIALAACNSDQHCVTDEEGETHCTEIKHCISEDGTVVDDNHCEHPGGSPDSHAGSMPFRWFYGGTGGRVYSPGAKISTVTTNNGGSYSPGTGRSYSSPTTISRGGFGSVGAGAAG